MALELSTSNPDHSALARPTSPRDPNGIAHATDPTDTGNGDATAASRADAKLAWAAYVADWKANSGGNPNYTQTFVYASINYV